MLVKGPTNFSKLDSKSVLQDTRVVRTQVVRTLGLIYTVGPDQDSVRPPNGCGLSDPDCDLEWHCLHVDQDPGLGGLAEA